MKDLFVRRHTKIAFAFVVISFVILLAGIATSVQLSKQSQDVRSSAAAASATFTVGADPVKLKANEEKTFPIVVDTGGLSVSAAVIALKVNPAVVTISKLEAGDKLTVVLQAAVIDQAAGTAKITLGTPPGQAFSGSGTVASITVKAKDTTGVSNIEFNGPLLQAAALNNQNNVAVAGATSSVSTGNVPAGTVALGAPTCGTKYKAGSPISMTATITAGTPADVSLFISKVTPDGKDLVNIAAGCPVGTPNGTVDVKHFCLVNTAASPATFSWTPNESQVGQYYVLINSVDRVQGVQCSANPKCGYSTDSPLNKYSTPSCQTWVDCSTNDFLPFEVVPASTQCAPPTAPPTAVPTAAPTAAPTTPPTAAPTAAPTVPPSPIPPAPVSTASAKIKFKLQGLTKAGVDVPTQFTFKVKTPTVQQVVVEKTIRSGASGALVSDVIPLSGITFTGASLDGVEVYAKTQYSLGKKLGTIKLLANQTVELASTAELIVGDFNQDGDQKNLFNILDITKMQGSFLELVNVVTAENRKYDVNYDGTYDILDLSLVIGNFQSLELPGDRP